MMETKVHSGTTAVIAWIVGETLVVANVGDSRAVLVKKDGSTTRLSKDHKPNLPEEKKRIKRLGGFVSPGLVPRVNGKVAVSRALGDYDFSPFITPEPYVSVQQISEDDAYIVLACDGVWDEMSDREVGNLVMQTASMVGPMGASKVAERIVMEALKRGSMDNISVVLVELGK